MCLCVCTQLEPKPQQAMSSGTLFEGFFRAVMLKLRRIYRRPWPSVVQAEPKKYLGLFTLPGIQGFQLPEPLNFEENYKSAIEGAPYC